MIGRRIARAVCILLAPSAPLFAADPALRITLIAQEGQVVPGVGAITEVFRVAVNDHGETLVLVETDNSFPTYDRAILRNGQLYLQEGQALPNPPGSSIGEFSSVNLNDVGDSGWNFTLDSSSASNVSSGLYFNTTLLIQAGDLVTAAGVSAGSPFIAFLGVKINDNGELLLVGAVDDPNVPSTYDRLLLKVDPASGAQTLLAIEGQLAPGLGGATISNAGGLPNQNDINDSGDALFIANTSVGSVIYLNSTIIAKDGSSSPIVGRTWASLVTTDLSLNNDGDSAFSGVLSGDSTTNTLIHRTGGDPVAQEGGTLPVIAPATFSFLGDAPNIIADRGEPADHDPDILWYAKWQAAGSPASGGLFLNERLLLQEDADKVGGVPISDITQSYAMSDGGRYVLAEVRLMTDLDTVLLIDRGPWRSTGGSLSGSTGAPRLRAFGQLSPGTPVTIDLTNAPASSSAALIVGFTRADLPFLGGTLVPNPAIVLVNLPVDADGTMSLGSEWPVGAPASTSVYLQSWVVDPSAPQGYSASNGLEGVSQ